MARLDINVVTSLVGKGLEREYLLLRELLNAHDVYVSGYHYCDFNNSVFVRADVNLYLEVVMPNVFNLAKENWLFPNSEWWGGVYDRFLPQFTKVCAKTRDCERLWRLKLANDRPDRVVYTGFEARDLYDPSIEREDRFLHVGGQSEFKNTESVIAAWKGYTASNRWPLKPFPLTVVTSQPRFIEMCEGVSEITCLAGRIHDDELRRLMNSHRFHLMPSAYEGFGHVLHEALGVGGLTITTNAPPMNEVNGVLEECRIPVVTTEPRMLAVLNRISPEGVTVACARAMTIASSPAECQARSEKARAAFLSDRSQFRDTILKMLGIA